MNPSNESKIVVITGGTGFIGSSLTIELLKQGYKLRILTRNPKKFQESATLPVEYFAWDPLTELAPAQALEGSYAVIHLAGESVAGARWNQNRKKAILESRSIGTRNLVDALFKLKDKPKVLVGTSAIGIYGNSGSQALTESSQRGQGFLSDVCQTWEDETFKAKDVTRVVCIRVGIVLGIEGGALLQMLPIFRMGLGGPLASGNQWMSWIHLDDLIAMYIFALENSEACGLLNGVAPNPVTNLEFTKSLATSLNRPAFFLTPAIAIRTLFGEMSTIILSSQNVTPQRALQLGFQFKFLKVQAALEDLLSPRGLKGAYTLELHQWIPAAKDKVFDFFSNAQNLETLTPLWLKFKIVKLSDPSIKKDTLIDYKLRVHGLPIKWRTLIEEWRPGVSFVDRMLKGPYRTWHHTHTFQELNGGTLICDKVIYRMPFGIIGNLVALVWVKGDISKIFNFRQKMISNIFGR